MDDLDFQYRKLIVWQKSMQLSKQVFLSIARGSLYEVMTQLEMAKEFGYLELMTPTSFDTNH